MPKTDLTLGLGRQLIALTLFVATTTIGVRSANADGSSSTIRATPVVRAIQRTSPSVVNIHGKKTIRASAAGMAGASADSFRQVNGMGTGVVIDPRGYVITNYHVVEDVKDIRVTLHNGVSTNAQLVAARIRNDLALIKINLNGELPVVPRGTSSDLMVGESVIAIGNAYGYVHTVTQGIISALHRDVPVNDTQDYNDLIQISAGINPGNSGGPLLNITGEMIGMNVAVRVGAQQIAFAIPIDQVVEIVTDMIESHTNAQSLTGLRTKGGPRDGDGVSVAHVSASSPASREGLKPGDRVVRIGSRSIDDRLDYALALLEVNPNQRLSMSIQRSGTPMNLSMVTSTRVAAVGGGSAAELAWSMLGIRTKSVPAATIKRLNARMRTAYQGGLYVSSVRSGSPADQQKIQAGDILLGIHGWQTTSVDDLTGILEHPDMQDGPRAKFYLVRRDLTLYGHMQIATRPTKRF